MAWDIEVNNKLRPCEVRINRRKFLKVYFMAGLMLGGLMDIPKKLLKNLSGLWN